MVTTVSEIMAPTPITARPDATVREIAQIMRNESIGAVLIAEGFELLGLVTDRDLVVRSLAAGLGPEAAVRGACSERLWSVDPETEVLQAAELMRNAAVRRLPVVRDGHALGSPSSVLGGICTTMPDT